MARNPESLKKILQLTPLAENSIKFEEFLTALHDHPGRADSAAAVLFRAIIAMGEEDIESEPSAKRRQYLRMLKDLGIPALKAFRHVAGSQRFAMQPLSFLRSAGDGGSQRLQMIIFDGGPGCGKDYFKDGIVNALEFYTEQVEKIYAVKGCPHNENPINLLKLLKAEQLKELATELEIPELTKVVDLACEPCPHCYKQLMGTVQEPKKTPNFDCVEVVPMRISSRSTGIADWQPGGKVSLVAALRKANRGFISMPDAFIERESRPGETDERLVLLDVTQYHRLPGDTDAEGNVSSNSPHDAIILATTNRNALDNFLDSVPDKGAFTSRAAILRLPYNTIRCEEVRAYETELRKYRSRAHFDPLVLEVLATLAVLSRLAKPRKKGKFVHPLDILKLYQGDSIQPKLQPEANFAKIWEASSSGSFFYGKANNWGPVADDDDDDAKTLVIPEDMPISTELLWSIADPEEGMNGLDMRLMMGLLSSINQLGLKKPGKEKVVSSLEVLGILRGVIARKARATNTNTTDQQEVYNRCLKWLGGVPVPGAEPSSTPDIIESEYRLMLRDMLLSVFAPDYEARAQKLFTDYRLHATALLEGKPTVKDPQLGTIPTNSAVVDELDRYRVGKGPKETLTDKDKEFRGQLDALISILRDEYNEQHAKDGETATPFKANWETIPEMASAIRGKLDGEIGKLIDKLITTEVKSDLSSWEQEQLTLAEQALEKLGFTHGLHKPILEYAKRTKVWSFKLS